MAVTENSWSRIPTQKNLPKTTTDLNADVGRVQSWSAELLSVFEGLAHKMNLQHAMSDMQRLN